MSLVRQFVWKIVVLASVLLGCAVEPALPSHDVELSANESLPDEEALQGIGDEAVAMLVDRLVSSFESMPEPQATEKLIKIFRHYAARITVYLERLHSQGATLTDAELTRDGQIASGIREFQLGLSIQLQKGKTNIDWCKVSSFLRADQEQKIAFRKMLFEEYAVIYEAQNPLHWQYFLEAFPQYQGEDFEYNNKRRMLFSGITHEALWTLANIRIRTWCKAQEKSN